MASPIQGVKRLVQSIWLDYIRRNLVTSGELKKLVQDGISGLASNPTIFKKAITQSNDYDEALRALPKANPDTDLMTIYEHLTIEDIRMAADILRPVYKASDGLEKSLPASVSAVPMSSASSGEAPVPRIQTIPMLCMSKA
jgi:transaldolase